MSVQKEMKEPIDYGDPAATSGISVFDRNFDELFSYDGEDLGLTYSASGSAFCLWAPTAQEAEPGAVSILEGSCAAADTHGARRPGNLETQRSGRSGWDVLHLQGAYRGAME